MIILMLPFRYYKFLPDSALAIKIRQKSWNLDNLLPQLKNRKSEFRELVKSIGSNPANILRVKSSINSLSEEIKAGIKNLKFINFYDSALLYLYFRLLHHVFDLCRREHDRLVEERQMDFSKKRNLKDQKVEDIKKAKEAIEEDIKEHERLIRGFDAAKRRLVETYENLVEELRKRRWDAEKQAQHEFAFLKFTLRSMKNLNRKIKVEAIKVKTTIIPQKTALMRRIQRNKQKINSQDVVELAKLVSKAINRISKDVLYSSKLISKFEKEMVKLKKDVEKLKKTINNLVKDEKKRETIFKKIIEHWDNIIKNLEDDINKDLMQIFSNIFREYKHVGTRPLKMAA